MCESVIIMDQCQHALLAGAVILACIIAELKPHLCTTNICTWTSTLLVRVPLESGILLLFWVMSNWLRMKIELQSQKYRNTRSSVSIMLSHHIQQYHTIDTNHQEMYATYTSNIKFVFISARLSLWQIYSGLEQYMPQLNWV